MLDKDSSKTIIFTTNEADDETLRQLESSILASALTVNELINNLVTKLVPTDFSDPILRTIYQAIYDLRKKSAEINKTSVILYIEKNLELSQTLKNPSDFINYQLLPLYNGAENFDFNVECVQVASIKRQLDSLCNGVVNTKIDISNYDETTFKWLNRFSEIIHTKKSADASFVSSVLDDIDLSISNHINLKNNGLTGIDSGFSSINELTDGFQRGDLIILAARPGTGKTALAINFALNGARSLLENNINGINNKKPLIVFFSMEMSKTELVQRMISREAKINLKTVRDFKLTDSDMSSYTSCKENLAQLPILICDTSGLTIMDIQSTLKRLSAEYDIQLVIVDYLQLIKLTNDVNSGFNRQQEVSTISRILKQTAREINTPIIALSQLSRKIEERKAKFDGENPRPVLSDLRESGAIEQDADIVTFLYYQHTPETADKEEEKPSAFNITSLPITLAIEKHRNGPTGDCTLYFTKQYGQFDDYNEVK